MYISRILIKILEVQSDTLALCVAVHDIGEYVRHYPRGKKFVFMFIFSFMKICIYTKNFFVLARSNNCKVSKQ